jgi:D-alanyl-D-alanine carboxypeptidase
VRNAEVRGLVVALRRTVLKKLQIFMAAAALAAGVAACSSSGDSAVDTGASTATGDSTHSYERVFASIVASDSPSAPPGVVALVRDARGTWRGAAGVASLASGEAMRPDHRFRIGSVTKTFTATLVLQLIGEGELGFDDTVERWLPGLLPEGERITVRQLLNHTSGLYNYTDSASYVRKVEREILAGAHFNLAPRSGIALAAKEPLCFEPGTSWEYSNTNYQVLGLIASA